MGKFKEIYIKYSNLEDFEKDIIKSYSNEFIYDKNNNKLLLSQYILLSNKFIYELKAKEGTAHLWTWSDFKDESKGKLLSYKNDNNIILSELMEFNEELNDDILNKYNLEIIKEFKF